MIRILNITEEGRGGGALYRIIDIAKALKGKVDFHIICPDESPSFTNQLKAENIPYSQMPFHGFSKWIKGILLYLFHFAPEVLKLMRHIKAHKPDIVYCNGSSQIKGVVAAKLTGVHSVWHMNDTYQFLPIRLLFKLIGPLATTFVFASERTQKYYYCLSKRIVDKTYDILPAPIDTYRFTPLLNGSVPRKIIDEINIVSIGYINMNKGLDTLIDCAEWLERNGERLRFKFTVIGPVLESRRAYKKMLDKKILESKLTNIHFIGFKKNTEEWLQNCDIYLCSSRYESSPIALWEALACGKAVVSTDVGDVKEIVEKYNCGIVVPTEDPEAMAQALLKLSEAPDAEINARSRQAALENFSLEVIAQEHLRFYKQILGQV